ncbi:MAG: hypothetical protein AAF909_00680 [Pseudomonadota bacterium]
MGHQSNGADVGLERAVAAALGDSFAARLFTVCAARGSRPGAFCLDAIRDAVDTAERRGRPPPRSLKEPSEQARAMLAPIVAAAVQQSADWRSLGEALATHDLAFRPSGGGLALVRLSTQAWLAKASDVGPGYAALVRRFGEGFPNHPHRHIAARVRAAASGPQPLERSAVGPVDGRTEPTPLGLKDDDALIDYGDHPPLPRGWVGIE